MNFALQIMNPRYWLRARVSGIHSVGGAVLILKLANSTRNPAGPQGSAVSTVIITAIALADERQGKNILKN
jgi:hypothetical protein